MESLPSAIVDFIHLLRPLFRAEVFTSFWYLMLGILIGEAKYGTARASVFAGADYWPQRLSDLFCRHKLSPQAFMAKLVEVALAHLYPAGLPARLFWIADSTYTEKPYAKRVASVGLFHRTKHVAGQAKHLKGHCYVFAAHLYQHAVAKLPQWASVLVGALMYVKGRSIPALVGALAQQLRLPRTVQHVWLVDRGILSRPLLRALAELGHGVVGRVRCNQVVYFAPAPEAGLATRKRRPRVYGQKCRVDQLQRHCADRLREQKMVLRVHRRERIVKVWDTTAMLRGVWRGRACPVRVIILSVPGLKLKPWYLLTTDLALEPCEAVRAYDGRYQIEVTIDEVKELGLAHYHGRSGQGVRRWPLFLCLGQMILKLIATRVLPVALPELHWSWYERENTVGQVQRRLIEACRPRISRVKAARPIRQKLAKAA
jgi:DDE family transposase